MSVWDMGKVCFVELQDLFGRIQIYVNCDEVCFGEDKMLFNCVFKKLVDFGDFLGVKGYVFKMQVGEIFIYVEEFIVFSKLFKLLLFLKIDGDGKVYDVFIDLELCYC